MIAACLSFCSCGISFATDLWPFGEPQVRYISPGQAYSIAAGGGVFVIADPRGQLLTSMNGVDWSPHLIRPGTRCEAVAYGNGKFISVGKVFDESTSFVYASPDGQQWTELSSDLKPQFDGPLRIVFAGDRFIVSDFRADYVSTDGISWQQGDLVGAFGIGPIAFGNGAFVSSDGGMSFTSRDAIHWVASEPAAALDSLLAFGAGFFVRVDHGTRAWRSTDGQSWTPFSITGMVYPFSTLAFAEGLFVLSGPEDTPLYTSLDGVEWTEAAGALVKPSGPIAYAGGLFVALRGYFGNNTPFLVSSRDGRAWSEVSLSTGSDVVFTSSVFWNGEFVAVGSAREGAAVARSSDGVDWRVKTLGRTDTIADIGVRDNLLVAVGGTRMIGYLPASSTNVVLISENAIDWSDGEIEAGRALNSVALSPDRWVAVGSAGRIVRSMDGHHWQGQSSGTEMELTSIAFGKNTFVAVGGGADYKGGILLSSPDGREWIPRIRDAQGTFRSVTYGSGHFLAVRWFAPSVTSSNGVDWIVHPAEGQVPWTESVGFASLAGAEFCGGWFVTGSVNKTWLSSDLERWPWYPSSQFGVYVSNWSLAGRTIVVPWGSEIASVELLRRAFQVKVVAASDASELGEVGSFTLLRSGSDPVFELPVQFSLSGTAEEGTDYAPLGKAVVLGPGQDQVQLPIVPSPDGLAEPNEFVTLQLLPGEAYDPDPNGTTIRIWDAATPVRIRPTTVMADSPGTIRFEAEVARSGTYVLERSNDLKTWEQVSSTQIAGHSDEFSDIIGSGVQRFYRVRTP